MRLIVYVITNAFSSVQFSSVHLLSHVWLFVTQWTASYQAFRSIPKSQVGVGQKSNSCPLSQWCHPVISSSVVPFSSCLQSFPPSGSFPRIQFFASGVSTSNEYSGLIAFRMDWFDLLAVQGTLKSLLQHHSCKTSFLPCSAFFIFPKQHIPA